MTKKNTTLIVVMMTATLVAGTARSTSMQSDALSERAQHIVTEVAEERIFDAAVALRVAARYAEYAEKTEQAAQLNAKADKALKYIAETMNYTPEEMQQKIRAADIRVIEQSRDKTDAWDGVTD